MYSRSIVNTATLIVNGEEIGTAKNTIKKEGKTTMNLCNKYGCPIYPFVVKVYDAEIENNDLVINLPATCCNVQNGQTASFVLCTRIPTAASIGNVLVKINGQELKLTKVGNVKTDQINCRTKYDITVATETKSALVTSCLPMSRYPFPVIEAENV